MGVISSFLDRVVANSDFRPEDVVLTPDHLAWFHDDESNDLESYPGPGWDEPGYRPSPEEAAEVLGFELGLGGEGEPFRCDDFSITTEQLFAARMGWARGRHEREERAWREEREYDAWIDSLAREREAELMLEDARGWHEAEVARVIGSVEARRRAD